MELAKLRLAVFIGRHSAAAAQPVSAERQAQSQRRWILSSSSYARALQDRRITPGSAMLAALSITTTLLLVIAGLIYYSGSSARTVSNYTTLASPIDQALTAEMSSYSKDLDHNLAAAKSDLSREVQTETSFDTVLATVGFQTTDEQNTEAALLQADPARISLLDKQAKASSFTQMQSYDARVQTASAAVAAQVKVLRQELGLPAVSGQLY